MSKGLLARLIGMLLSLLGLVYLLGPSPADPVYDSKLPKVPSYRKMDEYVHTRESAVDTKPGCEAKVVWHNDSIRRTKYVVLYLHGYSASHEEGNPVHRNLAKKLGANLYLARLCDHGLISDDALLNFSADCFWESAKEALMISRSLGDSVIILSTSKGGTAALMLAAEYPYIHSLINISPNIRVNDPNAFMLNDPWGLQIARTVLGSKYRTVQGSEEYAKYWNTKYRIESLVELEQIVETSMIQETFNRINIAVLNMYYYKNEQEQDPVVRVDKILDMHEDLGTPEDFKRAVAIPTAGDHVLGNPMKSEDIPAVEQAIDEFITEVLKIELKE